MSKRSKVKGYYDSGLWTVAMVANAVTKNWITAEEYLEITGEAYTAPSGSASGDLETRVAVMEDAWQKLGAIE